MQEIVRLVMLLGSNHTQVSDQIKDLLRLAERSSLDVGGGACMFSGGGLKTRITQDT